ncbi:MAG TPA: CDP-alcohol phosphatidyltransferase family protein [Casimicrobiaceae bacterium]
MSIYALKPRFQALLRPLAVQLARTGVTANGVTIAAAVISIVVGAFVAWHAPDRTPFVLIPLWMFVRMALNTLDGMLAREFGQQTRLGAFLNELGDVVADAALYLPFAWIPPFSAAWVAAVIVLATITELAGALGPTIGASRRYDGPFGKSDRAFAFGALGLWIGFGGPLSEWTAMLFPLFVVLLMATIVSRVHNALVETKSPR